MTGELSSFDQVSDEQADRLVAYCYVTHGPDAGRDAAIATLRDVHNVPPGRGVPVVDAAIRRAQGWTREQAEALSDQAQGWEEPPVPLDAVPVLPSFPADVFPSWIEAEISALAEFTQTPRDLAAMVVLGVLAAACSRCAIVEVTPGWSEPTNLYVLPAMASGSRKSPVYSPLVQPLLSAEKILADKAKDAITEARTTRAIADKAAVKAEKAAVEAAAAAAVIAADPDKSDEVKQQAEAARVAAAEDAVAKVKLAEAIEVPFVPRLIVNDVTPEKMAQLLVEQGGRLAILSDEGGPLVSLAGRYSTSKEPDAEVWLMSHSGLHAEIRVDRIGRGSDWVKNPALTVCIAIQPVVLRRLHRILQLRERGLLARFLFAMPADNVGYRKTRTTPVPDKGRRRLPDADDRRGDHARRVDVGPAAPPASPWRAGEAHLVPRGPRAADAPGRRPRPHTRMGQQANWLAPWRASAGCCTSPGTRARHTSTRSARTPWPPRSRSAST